MRRAMGLALAAAMLLPAGAAAQERGPADWFYQSAWCAYLKIRPYVTHVAADVRCDYEPRAMTLDEGAAFYQQLARRSNLVGDKWSCAARKAGDRWTWKKDQRWAKRSIRSDRRWQRQVASVTWPQRVQRNVRRLADLNAEVAYLQRRAFRHPTYAASLSSGDWAAYIRKADRYSPLAATVRAGLRLPDVPVTGNPCKTVKRIQRALGS